MLSESRRIRIIPCYHMYTVPVTPSPCDYLLDVVSQGIIELHGRTNAVLPSKAHMITLHFWGARMPKFRTPTHSGRIKIPAQMRRRLSHPSLSDTIELRESDMYQATHKTRVCSPVCSGRKLQCEYKSWVGLQANYQPYFAPNECLVKADESSHGEEDKGQGRLDALSVVVVSRNSSLGRRGRGASGGYSSNN